MAISISATNANQTEGNAGNKAFTFTVTSNANTTATRTVNFAVSGGPNANAVNGLDFGTSFPSGIVTFAPGVTSQVITVNVSGDVTFEQSEVFIVTLSSPVGDTLGTAIASGTIQNDDINYAIAPTNATQTEGDAGNKAFTFTITRSGNTVAASSVDYILSGSGNSPTDASDFGGTFPTGTVNFAAGVTTQVVTVDVSGDTTVESSETFTVTLVSNPTTPATVVNASATGTITNDDGTSLQIEPTNAFQTEGNGGNKAFTFTVRRSGNVSGASSANFAVTGSGINPATASDFGGTLPSGTVSFAAGATSQVITVNVSGDTAPEPSEGFTVTLSNPTSATITTASANGAIANDEILESTGINAFLNDTGRIYLSVDGNGTTGGTGVVQILKNSGATVRKAFLLGDGVGFLAPIGTSASVNGNNIAWDRIESTTNPSITFYSYLSDVTSVIKSTIDAAPAGIVDIAVNEGSESLSYEGLALAVVFDDPNQATDQSVILYFGGLRTTGGTATINFGSPINTASTLAATLGLGIGFSFNSSTSSSQSSRIRANGQLLTSVAGNFDDGTGGNGGLFTVGGLGDSPNNPPPASTDITTDDELYNILPFINNGDTALTINTINPSNDDHIFFAHLSLQGITATDSSNVVTLAVAPASVNEDGTGNLIYTFSRTGVVTNALTVGYTVGGSAILNTDYTQSGAASFSASNGTITFAAGANTTSLTIDPTTDAVIESNETVALTLTGGTGYAVGTSTAVTGTILDDDTPNLVISATNADKNEGNSGNTPFTFTVTRSGNTSGTSSANFAVTGIAADAADFGGTLPSGTVTFAAGETSQLITINVSGDTAIENNETFNVTLSNPTNATISGVPIVSGIIRNDDIATNLTIAPLDANKNEGNSGNTAFTFTVTRSGDISGFSSASYTITNSGANPANSADFGINAIGTVDFAANVTSQIITVNVNGDTEVEPDETFSVTLVSPNNATITTATATGTILNDDTSLNNPPRITSGASASFAEKGKNAAYTITAIDPDAGNTLTYTISGTDSVLFNVDAITGTVKFKNVPDFEAPADQGANNVYDFNVNASDGFSISSLAVAITVTDVSELNGTGTRDPLTGTRGNDHIVGGTGAKLVTGGLGNDGFEFNSEREIGQRITDFTIGEDKIVLTGLLASIGYSGTNPISDNFIRFVDNLGAGGGSFLQLDRDGASGSAIFRNFVQLDNIATTALNNVNNFVF
jgi:hypothetical protein